MVLFLSILKLKEHLKRITILPHFTKRAYSLQRNMVLIILNIRKVMEIYKGGLYDEKE